MIDLDWNDGPDGSACEHGHFCAWIEQLPVERRFAWTVDRLGDDGDADQIVILDSGVTVSLEEAKRAVYEAMVKLRASPRVSWRSREDAVVIQMPFWWSSPGRTQ